MLNVYSKDNEVETTITYNGDYDKRRNDFPVYYVECPNCGIDDEELIKFDVLGSSFDCPAYSKHDFLKYEVDKIHYICENCGCKFFKTYRHNNPTDNLGYSVFSWLKAEVTDDLWRVVRLVSYILIATILAIIGYASSFSGAVGVAAIVVLFPVTLAFLVEFLIFFME